MIIDNLSLGKDSEIYYDPGFRQVLEDSLTFILSQRDIKIQDVDEHDAYKYEGDFWGLLAHVYNVPYELHWLVMRLTGFTSPDQAGPDLKVVYIPNPSYIQQLLSNYQSSLNS